MLITFDIGNSAVKAASFVNDNLSELSRSSDIHRLLDAFQTRHFDSAAISSVVPAKTKLLTELIKERFGFAPFIVSHQCRLNLNLDYQTPETLGTDRICACEGALFIAKKNFEGFFSKGSLLLVIDAGTATTTNLIIYPGVFVGGTIAPGLKTMAQSLAEKTSLLTEVSLKTYQNPIGKSSADAVISGIFNSVFGQIYKVIEEAKYTYQITKYMIFGTGGLIDPIRKSSGFKIIKVEALVNYGLKEIYKLNK